MSHSIQEFLDVLHQAGVKSFHIEFAEPKIVAPGCTCIEPGRNAATAPEVELPKAAEAPLVQLTKAPEAPKAELPKAPEERKAEPPKAPEAPKAEPPKAEPKKTEAKKEKAKKEPPAEAPKPAPAAPLQDLYETFAQLVEQNDGTKDEEIRAMIAAMGEDNLLRVNNEFRLGLNMDVGLAEKRKIVAQCF